ncbi:PREDICTED: uncharacterized protein LOC106123548 [Papilio xuthus]|uniref:Calmodulin n=1 Tax=Papilio xuthus TaxID=66420 RepID=A0A194QEI8_PAPXU|nr:PREDICTED: uncharacterized protein LOC106123548 [Papilio xuthus]KPJ01881.1 Calmodulin [Papilio xuthus]
MENDAIENDTVDKVKSEIAPAETDNVEQPENVGQTENVEQTENAEQPENVDVPENLDQQENVDQPENVQDEPTDETQAIEGEENKEEKKEEKPEVIEDVVEEEEQFVEEPPPDPAAPYNLTDSTEALKPPFALRHDQLAEVEQLWDVYQDYNPAYTDIDNYITEKELIYMLKALLLMTYTPEQLQELIDFCVRPPHPDGHITFEQFVKIVTIRQRAIPIEEELRLALQSLDPNKTGLIDREFFKELLSKQGHKLPPKMLENLIKEVDLSNDGTIGIEDVVGTLGIDLNKDDIAMLRAAVFPDENPPKEEEEF